MAEAESRGDGSGRTGFTKNTYTHKQESFTHAHTHSNNSMHENGYMQPWRSTLYTRRACTLTNTTHTRDNHAQPVAASQRARVTVSHLSPKSSACYTLACMTHGHMG